MAATREETQQVMDQLLEALRTGTQVTFRKLAEYETNYADLYEAVQKLTNRVDRLEYLERNGHPQSLIERELNLIRLAHDELKVMVPPRR